MITMAANMLISKVKISRWIIGFHWLYDKERFIPDKKMSNTKIYLDNDEKKNRTEWWTEQAKI